MKQMRQMRRQRKGSETGKSNQAGLNAQILECVEYEQSRLSTSARATTLYWLSGGVSSDNPFKQCCLRCALDMHISEQWPHAATLKEGPRS
jgi:hypothetical protein